MDILLLRLIHIVSGAFWFGAVFSNFLFVQPAIRDAGPEGQKVMLQLLRNRRFADAVLGAAVLTALAGGTLFWIDSNGLQLRWVFGAGLGFTIGGLSGLLALLMFVFVGYPTTRRAVALGSRLAEEQRPPTPDEQAVLVRAQRTLKNVGIAVMVLVGLAAVAMATARYWFVLL
jgi:uncharacterized membrane protein